LRYITNKRTFAPRFLNGLIAQTKKFDSVAQLVEQYTFNVWVLGSSPSGITKQSLKKIKTAYSERMSGFFLPFRLFQAKFSHLAGRLFGLHE
jgi:hypothetical protein